MKRIKWKRAAAAVILTAAACLCVVFMLWLSGFLLPRWIVWKDAEVPFRVPFGWRVQDALRFDINGDGSEEAILLVWKRGSYGEHRPTWVKRDELGFSQHIFIYAQREDDSWHPIWMSSKLGRKVLSFAEGEEIGGTGRSCLVITETDGTVTRWGWLTWGLTRIN